MIDYEILKKSKSINTIYWQTQDIKNSIYFDTINYLTNGVLEQNIKLPLILHTMNFGSPLQIHIIKDVSKIKRDESKSLLIQK